MCELYLYSAIEAIKCKFTYFVDIFQTLCACMLKNTLTITNLTDKVLKLETSTPTIVLFSL